MLQLKYVTYVNKKYILSSEAMELLMKMTDEVKNMAK